VAGVDARFDDPAQHERASVVPRERAVRRVRDDGLLARRTHQQAFAAQRQVPVEVIADPALGDRAVGEVRFVGGDAQHAPAVGSAEAHDAGRDGRRLLR
jgi:hypothetical protein